jgi:flavin reductase (DIM6/NTAB) family NADH-FMN oxidoreductase RutF
MKFDINALPPAQQYKLLSSSVVPRPIALETTISDDGRQNAAPFSFFNVMGENPPVLVLGLQEKADRSLKDTTVNIQTNGQFVVHTVDEDLAEAMNVCGVDFPAGESEAERAGLSLVASDLVRPARIAEAPVAFECEKIAVVQISPGRHIAMGKVLTMHVRDGLIDADTLYMDPEKYRPVGRLFGLLYTRTRDQFELPRPTYQEWLQGRKR